MVDDFPRPLVTRSDLVRGLRDLGVESGATAMVHTRMSSLGWVVGGADVLVEALLEAVGPDGTIMATAGWEADAYHFDAWDRDVQDAYLADPPVFDPLVSETDRSNGRIPERIRTWPGALRSGHPVASFTAIGARAAELLEEQPWDHPMGVDSPLERLVDAGGIVVMLGAPLETITLLHLAEELATPPKNLVTYRMALRTTGGFEWRSFEDIESSLGAYDYADVVEDDIDGFEAIARDALEAGIGTRRGIGSATCHLFPARDLVRFAVDWIEANFS